jgi:hypothetical protein
MRKRLAVAALIATALALGAFLQSSCGIPHSRRTGCRSISKSHAVPPASDSSTLQLRAYASFASTSPSRFTARLPKRSRVAQWPTGGLR